MEITDSKRPHHRLERRKAEQDLQASQRLLRAVFDAIPHNLYVKDLQGRYLMVNKALARFSGRPEADSAGGQAADVGNADPEARERVDSSDRAAVASGQSQDAVVRLHHAEGGDQWIRSITVPLRDDAGRVIGSVGLGEDITAQKLAEEAARKSEALLIEAQKLAQVGSWELDLVHDALTWSEGIYHIFEIDKEQSRASYETFFNAVHPEDREAVRETYARSIRSHEPYEIVHRLRMPDGRIKFVQEHGVTHYSARGEALRSLGTVQFLGANVIKPG